MTDVLFDLSDVEIQNGWLKYNRHLLHRKPHGPSDNDKLKGFGEKSPEMELSDLGMQDGILKINRHRSLA